MTHNFFNTKNSWLPYAKMKINISQHYTYNKNIILEETLMFYKPSHNSPKIPFIPLLAKYFAYSGMTHSFNDCELKEEKN